MKTVMGSKQTVQRHWVVIDVKDKVLGRAATTIASVLRGKHKRQDKKYIHHTQYPGGLREYTAEEAVARHPTRLVEDAVRRMLPRTNLGRALMKKLKIYAGDKHPHAAQKPTAMEATNA